MPTEELTPAELDAIRSDVHNDTPNRPTTVEANGRATIYWQHCRDLLAHIDALAAKVVFYKDACAKANMEVCQTLGAALGYPRFCDDQANFPGSTEADGVCFGEHVAETIAMEAARRIAELAAKVERLEGELKEAKDDLDAYRNSGGYGL